MPERGYFTLPADNKENIKKIDLVFCVLISLISIVANISKKRKRGNRKLKKRLLWLLNHFIILSQ